MEIIFLHILLIFFLARKNSLLAIKKGLKPLLWTFLTLLAWLCAEIIGFVLGVILFGNSNVVAVIWIAIAGAFGGYLLIRYILEQHPDPEIIKDDRNKVGVDDLKPPKS